VSVIIGSGLAGIVEDLAAAQSGNLTILEAGCGRLSHWAYPEGAEVTGLDISADQLARNERVQEKFEGDVQTWETDRQWDVVASVYVLEHIDDPRRGVANMLAWTRPGGLLVLAVPNAFSLKGLVTKMTPFWFHGWFYRNIYRRPHAIFPTVMDWSITPSNLRKQLEGHEIILERFDQEQLSRVFNLPYRFLVGLLRILSFGRWKPGNANYLLVVKKAG
jgi:2-polyprenyl-3-methyl-5-hydroxy-6-metoxy-1,4-benzoquinol methylase